VGRGITAERENNAETGVGTETTLGHGFCRTQTLSTEKTKIGKSHKKMMTEEKLGWPGEIEDGN
jgi:hypothetical protein